MKYFLFTFLFLSATLLGKSNIYDKYLETLPRLQEQEDWVVVIDLGEKALRSKGGSLDQKAHVHADLASAYFYLGNYALGEIHAYECLKLSKELKNQDSLIKSLYLLSAHKRGIGNTEDIWAFHEAQDLIDKALQLLENSTPDMLKGKVYFNAGAAYADDPHGNLDLAIEYYTEALAYFRSSKCNDSFQRASIRLGKALLLKGRLDTASECIAAIDESRCTQRTLVHLLYLKAQIEIERYNYEVAEAQIQRALKITQEHGFRVDQERLLSLQEEME